MENNAAYWKAKHDALAAGINDAALIDNAERLVEAAWQRAIAVPLPNGYAFEATVDAMLRLVSVQRPIAVDLANAKVLTLSLENEALKEALRPFAIMGDVLDEYPDMYPMMKVHNDKRAVTLYAMDFRRAKETLAQEKEGDHAETRRD